MEIMPLGFEGCGTVIGFGLVGGTVSLEWALRFQMLIPELMSLSLPDG